MNYNPILFRSRKKYTTATPSITLTANTSSVSMSTSGSTNITLTLVRSNYTGDVTLTVGGLPSNVTGTFSDSLLNAVETTSTLTITTNSAAAVTNAAFTITASGPGVTDFVLNTLLTVVSRGSASTTGIIKQDQFNYANRAALLANFPATASTFNFNKLYSYMSDISGYGMVDLETSSVLHDGHPTMRYTIDPSQSSPPQAQVYFPASSVYQNVGLYWVMKFGPGFTTAGTQAGQSNAYKITALGYDSTNGRTGLEFTNTDDYSYVGGWGVGGVNSNSDNIDMLLNTTMSTGNAQAKSPPYAPPKPAASGGVWSSSLAVYHYMEYRKVNAYQADIKFWTWTSGSTPRVSPDSHQRITMNTGSSASGSVVPLIDRISLGQNYNHGTGWRPGAPYYLYWCDWRIYDLDTNSNPCNLT